MWQRGTSGGDSLPARLYQQAGPRVYVREAAPIASSSLYGSRAGAYRNLPAALELRGHFLTRRRPPRAERSLTRTM